MFRFFSSLASSGCRLLPRRIVGLLLRGLGIVGNGGFVLENELCLREGNSGVDSFLKMGETNGRRVWGIGREGIGRPQGTPLGGAGEGIEE